MSTLNDPARHPRQNQIATGTCVCALSAIIATGLAIILAPTGDHTTPPHRPDTGATIQTHPTSAAVVTPPAASAIP